VERSKNGTARHLGACAPGAGSPDFRAFPVSGPRTYQEKLDDFIDVK
jgi:hypothetical protein